MQDPTAILSNPIMPSCQLPDVAFRGSMVYWYNSTSFRDDLAWAASWMYKATGDPDYLGDAYGFWDTHKMLEGDYDIRYLVRFMPPVRLSVCDIFRLRLRATPGPAIGGAMRFCFQIEVLQSLVACPRPRKAVLREGMPGPNS